jgi:hypothetical protein
MEPDPKPAHLRPARRIGGGLCAQASRRRNPKPAPGTRHPAPEPDTRNPTPDTRNPTPDTRNPNPTPGTRPAPVTRNPEPDTRNPEPGTRNPEPGTRHPAPDTRNPEPTTHHPHPGRDAGEQPDCHLSAVSCSPEEGPIFLMSGGLLAGHAGKVDIRLPRRRRPSR